MISVRFLCRIVVLLAGLWPVTGMAAVEGGVDSAASGSVEFPSIYHTDSLREVVLLGIRLTADDQFARAESLFIGVSKTYPSSPVGPLFVAAAVYAQMMDRESPARAAAFEQWLKTARRRAERWRAAAPASGEPEFVLGTLLGYQAVFESRWGGWFAALKKGLQAKKHFDAALRKDSTLVDACLGIGNYNYWKSVKTDFINWLPIIADDRLKGLAQLRRVASEGVLAAAAARASLCRALIHDGRYTEALAHSDTLATLFPDAKGPLWISAAADFHLYRWQQALDRYREIERRISAEGPGNYYNLIDCAYFEAQCLYNDGRWTEALKACHRGLSYPAPEDIRDRQKGKLKSLRALQKKLKKMTATAVAVD